MNRSFLTTFKNPGCEFRGAPFWSWNGRLKPEELRQQVREMHKMGLGGFFMHSRVGLATPYLSREWFDCIQASVDEAKKLGMKAWLYDEDRWPSGAAGGLVTRNPKYRMRYVLMERIQDLRGFQWDKDVFAAFLATFEDKALTAVKELRKGTRPRKLEKNQLLLSFRHGLLGNDDWYNGYTYLDTMNHEAVREFIRVTHEAYRKNNHRDFAGTIPGIFTDEPNYGRVFAGRPSRLPASFQVNKTAVSIPWTPKLQAIFKKRYGYDVIRKLPEIFYDYKGTQVSRTRYHYLDCITHLFVDAFARQIGEWCDRNQLMHTGHVLSESICSSQTSVVGATMRFYEYMQAPGIDVLTEYKREYDTAKQCTSVARQFGRRWRLSETYGCSGWDFSFLGHKAVSDWQTALGINLRAQHLAWYTMLAEAKRDYPAAISCQSPWWDLYPKVEDYFGRINAVMDHGHEVRDLLVIHPIESQWLINSLTYKDLQVLSSVDKMLVRLRDSLLFAHLDFDYGDEVILRKHASIRKKQGKPILRVGQADYTTVLVPSLITIRSSTLSILRKFQAAGGTVVFAGAVPAYVDAQPSDAAGKLAAVCPRSPAASGPKLIEALETTCRHISVRDRQGIEAKTVLYQLREDKDAFYLFLCNTSQHRFSPGNLDSIPARDRKVAYPDVCLRAFRGCAGSPLELDPDTGAVFSAAAEKKNNEWEIRTSFPPLGSRLFVCPKKKEPVKYAARPLYRDIRTSVLGNKKWDVSLSEANVLVLDRPRYRIGGNPWNGPEEILRVDSAVRESLGMKPRGGKMVQPWVKTPVVHPKRVSVELVYAFDVTKAPGGKLSIGLERPETFKIQVNGNAVDMDAETGWWCDRALRTVSFDPAYLRTGTNEIVLTCDYDETHSGLEIVYLIGHFGTRVAGPSVAITPMPSTLQLGDWVKQGLAFYSGHVAYRKIIRPVRRTGDRVFVQVPEYRGTAVRVLVNGQTAGLIGWEPNEVDITDYIGTGPAELTLEVIGHRRNSHGPFHYFEKSPTWTGPAQFVSRGDKWVEGYQLVSCGLMSPPRLITRRAEKR